MGLCPKPHSRYFFEKKYLGIPKKLSKRYGFMDFCSTIKVETASGNNRRSESIINRRLMITDYRLPFTVYRLPITIHRSSIKRYTVFFRGRR